MNKNCKKSGPLRVRLSTEKKLLTVRVGLFSLREKAPTKKNTHCNVGLFFLREKAPTKKLPTVIVGLFSLRKKAPTKKKLDSANAVCFMKESFSPLPAKTRYSLLLGVPEIMSGRIFRPVYRRYPVPVPTGTLHTILDIPARSKK